MSIVETETKNIEFSNYGQRSSVMEEIKGFDSYLRSSKGMYCEECAKKGKRIFSRFVIQKNRKMKALCDTCNKRQHIKDMLSR